MAATGTGTKLSHVDTHVPLSSDSASAPPISSPAPMPMVAGSGVVQVYYSPLSTSRSQLVRYKRMLAGFAKVHVPPPPGKVRAAVTLRVQDLGYTVYDPITNTKAWTVDPGEYRLWICRSSCDCPLNMTFTV